MNKKKAPYIAAGDLVRVIPPHGEAGARGIVEKVYPENADYERRARAIGALVVGAVVAAELAR
jgi:hypothetical protein